jgi:hypothetical protein
MPDQGQRRRITARVSAAGEKGCDNPRGQRLTAPLPFPVLSLSCALQLLSFACVLPLCPQARHEFYQSFFIDTIVHISVLNDNLPSERLIIFQRFGVHPTPQDFVRCGVSSFVTFERKSRLLHYARASELGVRRSIEGG